MVVQSQPGGARVQLLQDGSPKTVGTTPCLVSSGGNYTLALPGYRPAAAAPGTVLLQPSWTYPFVYHAPALLGLALAGLAGATARVGKQVQRLTAELQPNLEPVLEYGQYRIVRKLGEGAMAEVFLAHHPEIGSAALKVLFEHVCAQETFRVRFEREVGTCKRLDHPRIVKTYDTGIRDGRLWMAQQYVPGSNLSSWLKKGGIHPSDARRILLQIAEGLAYAHEHGVVHRDLKPDNLLLNARGEVLIADFGMARSQEYKTLTATDEVLGTPAYMAPEQAQALKVDGRADLYALGVLGYELLTGELPFQGDAVAVIIAHITQNPVPVQERKPSVPDKLAAAVTRLLQKDPEARYQTAGELIQAL